VYAQAGLSTYRHRYIGKYVRMYCRSIWRPTWRSFAAHTSPPPSNAPLRGSPPLPRQHASLTTHSLIHSLSCSSISWAFRTQAGPNESDRSNPTVHNRPTEPSKPSKPSEPSEPSNGKPQPLHATRSFSLSAFQPLPLQLFCPRFGFGIYIWGQGAMGTPSPSLIASLLHVRTHLCVHPRGYVLKA